MNISRVETVEVAISAQEMASALRAWRPEEFMFRKMLVPGTKLAIRCDERGSRVLVSAQIETTPAQIDRRRSGAETEDEGPRSA